MSATLHRLFVSHSFDNITKADLEQRFKSFSSDGTCRVERFRQTNAVGLVDPFCFVELLAEAKQVQRCLSSLNKSNWKGVTILVQPAKPSHTQRMAAKTETEIKEKTKKRKRIHGTEGKESANISETVNVDNMNGKKGWRKSDDKKHPIFPIVDRPLHPLPPAPSEKDVVKKDKKAKTKDKDTKRAKRQKIDPTKWQPSHLAGEEAITEKTKKLLPNAGSAEPERAAETAASISENSDSDSPAPSEIDQDSMQQLDASLDPEARKLEKAAQLSILQNILEANKPAKVKSTSEKSENVNKSTSKRKELETPAESAKETDAKEPAQPVKGKRKRVIESANIPADQLESSYKPVPRYIPEEIAVAEETPVDNLKEMFKPKEADDGFKLGDFLADIELEDQPFEEPIYRQNDMNHESTNTIIAPVSTRKPAAPKNGPLFFPLNLDDPSDRLIQSLQLNDHERARLEERSWNSGTGRRFRRLGTEADMITRHTENRAKLTAQVKKRHREGLRKANKTRPEH